MVGSGNGSAVEIVLAGGGHSHVEVLRRFGMNRDEGVRLTLITKDYHAPYSGMLPGMIAGHYSYRESHIDLEPLCRYAGCRLFRDEVVGLDLERKVVLCKTRPAAPFDLVSVNVGSSPVVSDVPGALEYALPVKPVQQFLKGWELLQERVAASEGPFRVVTIGGGAGGVELTLAMQHRLREMGLGGKVRFCIGTADADVLLTHNARVRRKMNRVLRERDVDVRTDHRAVRVTREAVEFEGRDPVTYDALIWVTQAAPAPWVGAAGVAVDDRGFIAVDETLRSVSHPFVFSAGDVATMVRAPRPKSGVFAVRQGPILHENLLRAARGEALVKFTPQTRFLGLISTGDKNAIASRGGLALEGGWVWKWKDWIDTRWMAKYRDLPVMDGWGGEEAMRCGGCGGKVGPGVLATVLQRLREGDGGDGLLGFDCLDDAAVFTPRPGKVAVQSVDFFRTFLDDPYLFGQVTAHHCLNDLYAMGATPESALAQVMLPHGEMGRYETLLHDVLAGALRVLRRHGCALAGGHTAEGVELTFGLTVNGYGDEGELLRKGGMGPSDRLILTKALGTGVIFAGDMRGRARGEWVAGAIEGMLQSNREAVECLREHGVTACTDVSGFGLAGHLVEMLRASGAGAEVRLDGLPLLEGVAELMLEGVASSLYGANAEVGREIVNAGEAGTRGVYSVLFDPQTAGGLLAAVPGDRAEGCVEALRGRGYVRAAVVGSCVEGSGELAGRFRVV